jgi:hypothetical protein
VSLGEDLLRRKKTYECHFKKDLVPRKKAWLGLGSSMLMTRMGCNDPVGDFNCCAIVFQKNNFIEMSLKTGQN